MVVVQDAYIKNIMEKKFTISDLENITGIKSHTIRMWEKRYGVIVPERTETNIRRYDESQLKKLINISFLNKNGIKISHLAKMSEEQLNDTLREYSSKIAPNDHILNELISAMLEVNEVLFEKNINKLIIEYGFEQTFLDHIFPFFNKLGTLWEAGSVMPSQEHFVSNIVRQKLLVETNYLPNVTNEHSKTVLLYLPEDEHHELGLLFAQYLIKKQGFKTLYLGQNVPNTDLKHFTNTFKPDYAVTSIIHRMKKSKKEKILRDITHSLKNIEIWVSGDGFSEIEEEYAKHVFYIPTFHDLKIKLQTVKEMYRF